MLYQDVPLAALLDITNPDTVVWLQSRLTELELHVNCQSDSVASTDFDGDSLRQDSKFNRESII